MASPQPPLTDRVVITTTLGHLLVGARHPETQVGSMTVRGGKQGVSILQKRRLDNMVPTGRIPDARQIRTTQLVFTIRKARSVAELPSRVGQRVSMIPEERFPGELKRPAERPVITTPTAGSQAVSDDASQVFLGSERTTQRYRQLGCRANPRNHDGTTVVLNEMN